MHDKIEILDIERENDHFTVVFEVPGEHYDQDYPKRLKHGFPLRERFFKKVELADGEEAFNFEKYLVNSYVDTEEDKKRKQKAAQKLENNKDELKNKEYGKNVSEDKKP